MRVLLTLPLSLLAPAAAPADPSNIIFILSDDVAQGELGCYGQKLIKTPNLDRMAAEGTRYLQAYTGTTVCAPTRSSLMTGLHMGHCPVRANREIKPEGQMPLPEGTYTVAKLLNSQGYATACIGKWGMGMFHTSGSPLKMGFDHFFGYNCQRHAHSYFPKFLYNDDQRFLLPGNQQGREDYAQDLIADETLRWVREHKEGPFFLFYAATLPHGRFEIDDQGIYKDKPWPEMAKNYAAMVRWPGTVPAGGVTEEPWAFWDFLPTVVELVGAELPEGVQTDGVSLVEFLRGGPAPKREYFYWELHEGRPIQAIRFGDWKAVRNGPGQPLELYDLSRDIGETNNLAADHPDLVAKAEEMMRKARVDDPHWPLAKRSRRP